MVHGHDGERRANGCGSWAKRKTFKFLHSHRKQKIGLIIRILPIGVTDLPLPSVKTTGFASISGTTSSRRGWTYPPQYRRECDATG